jgi:hypothetical protein
VVFDIFGRAFKDHGFVHRLDLSGNDDPPKAGLFRLTANRFPNERRQIISNERDMPYAMVYTISAAAPQKALGYNPQLLVI